MASIDTATPVVVVQCARHGGLAITRTLGRWGVPVYNVDDARHAPAFYSRYSRGRFTWDMEHAPPQETLRFLRGVAAKAGGRPILIPTSDSTAMFVADHGDALSQWYDFPRMEPSLVRRFTSKREMYFLAKQFGVATAETAFPQSPAELIEHLPHVKFPVMAKGIFGVELEAKSGKRMFVVNDRSELLDVFDKYEDWKNPNIMVQEFIPGNTEVCWMANGYFDRNSNCLLSFTGHKLRQYPAYTGLTSLGLCRENDAVARTTREFMKACGYRGILDIGYRYDERDGQYKVIDINPRVGATFRLFTGVNGMDVVRALYLDMTGQPVEAAPAKDGRKWLVEDCDVISSLRYFRDGKLAFGEWLRSLRGIDETALFAVDDPVPAVWMVLRDLAKLGKRPEPARNATVSPTAARSAA